MNLTILYWVLIAVMLVGVVGAAIPGIPGPSLILAAIVVWGIATGFANMGWPIVAVFIVLILSAGIDFLATYWGAKQFGASNWASTGAIIGLVLGFLGFLPALPFGGPLLGILLGPVLGAFIGEFLYQRNLELSERTKTALKVSLAVVVSSLIGNLLEMLLAIAAVAIFVVNTWPIVSSGI